MVVQVAVAEVALVETTLVTGKAVELAAQVELAALELF